MPEPPKPLVLVPGLLTSPRLYAEQLPALWRHGPVTIADNTPEQTRRRDAQIDLARGGRFAEIADQQFPLVVHRSRHDDPAAREVVRLMASETGPEAFIRQQQAIMGRSDSRPGLAGIGCPTLVLVGDGDELTPPDLSAEIADGIPGARLVMMPGAGHLSTLDQPRQVTQALLEWLQA
jgi:pimeloyl-ACP methyl ester carboxylesterase